MSLPPALGQVSRMVRDIAASTAWYRDVLELTHLYSFREMAFFDCGGVRLYLQQGEAGAESLLYFKVDDVATAHATLSSKGVTFVTAPHMVHRHADGTEEWMAFFSDLEGRPLALMAQTRPGLAKTSTANRLPIFVLQEWSRTQDHTGGHTKRQGLGGAG